MLNINDVKYETKTNSKGTLIKAFAGYQVETLVGFQYSSDELEAHKKVMRQRLMNLFYEDLFDTLNYCRYKFVKNGLDTGVLDKRIEELKKLWQ